MAKGRVAGSLLKGGNVAGSVLTSGGKKNKLAKARKTRTSPNTLGLKKFGMGKLWSKKFFGSKSFSGQKKFFGSKTFFRSKKFFGSNKFFWLKKAFGPKKFSGQKSF